MNYGEFINFYKQVVDAETSWLNRHKNFALLDKFKDLKIKIEKSCSEALVKIGNTTSFSDLPKEFVKQFPIGKQYIEKFIDTLLLVPPEHVKQYKDWICTLAVEVGKSSWKISDTARDTLNFALFNLNDDKVLSDLSYKVGSTFFKSWTIAALLPEQEFSKERFNQVTKILLQKRVIEDEVTRSHSSLNTVIGSLLGKQAKHQKFSDENLVSILRKLEPSVDRDNLATVCGILAQLDQDQLKRVFTSANREAKDLQYTFHNILRNLVFSSLGEKNTVPMPLLSQDFLKNFLNLLEVCPVNQPVLLRPEFLALLQQHDAQKVETLIQQNILKRSPGESLESPATPNTFATAFFTQVVSEQQPLRSRDSAISIPAA